MDLQFKEMLCPCCKTLTMIGSGGHFGGRIDSIKLRCSTCDLTLLIIPMKDGLQYDISATTEAERIEKRIQEARDKSELELAKTITRIRETGY